jgi:hypothetical protein
MTELIIKLKLVQKFTQTKTWLIQIKIQLINYLTSFDIFFCHAIRYSCRRLVVFGITTFAYIIASNYVMYMHMGIEQSVILFLCIFFGPFTPTHRSHQVCIVYPNNHCLQLIPHEY